MLATVLVQLFQFTPSPKPKFLNLPNRTFNVLYSGLLISGGRGLTSAGQSVEVFVPSMDLSCQLPDLPDERQHHTQEKNTVCGGVELSSGTSKSCLTLTDAGWERTTTLREER